MPTWGEILTEINTRWTDQQTGVVDLDGMRRNYLIALHQVTGRNTVTYYTDWMGSNSPDVSINLTDLHGLMEVFKDLDRSRGLDLLIHSPGGDPTAADSLVRYMRAMFDDVRVIVPVAAMSAATMWSLAADRIMMGRHSQLGPIDPQLVTPSGSVPAGAILRQFDRAKEECKADPSALSAWMPTLQQYFPGLLEMCDDSTRLSKTLVEEYLREHMFAGRDDRADLARVAAEFFANDTIHIAHGRGIRSEQLREYAIEVEDLEADSALQDAVLSVHHAYMHTLGMTPTQKITENQLGRAVIKSMPMMQMMPPGFPPTMPVPGQ